MRTADTSERLSVLPTPTSRMNNDREACSDTAAHGPAFNKRCRGPCAMGTLLPLGLSVGGHRFRLFGRLPAFGALKAGIAGVAVFLVLRCRLRSASSCRGVEWQARRVGFAEDDVGYSEGQHNCITIGGADARGAALRLNGGIGRGRRIPGRGRMVLVFNGTVVARRPCVGGG
mmetsp:Transcript_30590/g.88653  ORF Transcript_30590/g.88653 Transcript_30590/m.88653 type:complete len:173 (-) Transcript_30590:1501-2019(-)